MTLKEFNRNRYLFSLWKGTIQSDIPDVWMEKTIRTRQVRRRWSEALFVFILALVCCSFFANASRASTWEYFGLACLALVSFLAFLWNDLKYRLEYKCIDQVFSDDLSILRGTVWIIGFCKRLELCVLATDALNNLAYRVIHDEYYMDDLEQSHDNCARYTTRREKDKKDFEKAHQILMRFGIADQNSDVYFNHARAQLAQVKLERQQTPATDSDTQS